MAIDRVATLRNAEKLLRQGKLDQAIGEYVRIVDDQPRDWNTANTLGDLYLRAGRIDEAVEQFTRIADGLSRDGFLPKAAALYKKVLKAKPNDEHALLQAAEIAASQGLLVDARAYLNAVCDARRRRGDVAGLATAMIRLAVLDPHDHNARLAGARARVEIGDVAGAVSDLKQLASELMEQGQGDQALVALREAAHFAPADLEVMVARARVLAARGDAASVDESQALVAQLTEAAVVRGDWASAAALLQESLTRTPNHVPSLLWLVEICVDGGLDSTIGAVQAQLADAYLAAGSAAEARFIAEDLVAREPGNPSHIERLRRALTILGESDPDATIASHLAGVGTLDELEARERSGRHQDSVRPVTPIEPVESIEPIERFPRAASRLAEVDLTIVLDDIKGSRTLPSLVPRDIDAVFADFRDEVSRRVHTDGAHEDFTRGMALYQAGQLDEAVPALQLASREPRYRFEAASALGRIFLQRGETWPAIEWLERAAQAPAPTSSDSHRLLYELADALEAVGEVARALAICLELRADAGDYHDVATRVDRLSKVQARG